MYVDVQKKQQRQNTHRSNAADSSSNTTIQTSIYTHCTLVGCYYAVVSNVQHLELPSAIVDFVYNFRDVKIGSLYFVIFLDQVWFM